MSMSYKHWPAYKFTSTRYDSIFQYIFIEIKYKGFHFSIVDLINIHHTDYIWFLKKICCKPAVGNNKNNFFIDLHFWKLLNVLHKNVVLMAINMIKWWWEVQYFISSSHGSINVLSSFLRNLKSIIRWTIQIPIINIISICYSCDYVFKKISINAKKIHLFYKHPLMQTRLFF